MPQNRKDNFQNLYKIILSLETKEELSLFLEDLCTPVELESLADRWTSVLELKNDKPYRRIHEDTGVSITTVGRVARSLSYGAGGYELAYQKLEGSQNER
tara:strand:- start:1208 stop:1507 length:300 start_codon:yes stop_codon:yes gene_type:complete